MPFCPALRRSRFLLRVVSCPGSVTADAHLHHHHYLEGGRVNSYAVMVITGVGDRATARIGRLVHLDAANPVSGDCNADHGNSKRTREVDGKIVNDVELFMFPNEP